ncbi:helicase RepA family protein [Marinobacter sp. ATCH36]|uniref:AAA family ATPase n=1 Tax=Marinobacter sp. ATCH36 TaxID=2945106 RepID=UPI002022936D|nr:helicase RepA family protein [Marinobacter sp. ATCH36]MCL7944062.1 helicase RepA family protein [Marinobacter sp. ATCH36]
MTSANIAPLVPEAIYPDSIPPFRFVVAANMAVNPVCWLVDGYIEEDALAVMYGPPGKGKSFLALDMSCCIATDTPFHGHSVKNGAVFYIAGEGHNGLARRLRAWAEHNANEMPELLFVSEAPAELSSASSAASVAQAVEQLADITGEAPALIVVDTLARNFGGDENSATDMGQFVRNADALRRRWKATVLIVHHSGKDGDRGARGSSALKGAADAEYEVSRSEEDELIRLTPRKMKDAEEPQPLAFELVTVPIHDDTGEPIAGAALRASEYTAPTPVTAKLGKQQKAALGILEQLHCQIAEELASQGREDHAVNVTVDLWKKRCEKEGIPRQRFHDAKNTLAEREQVRLDGPHVYFVRPVRSSLETPDRTDSPNKTKIGQTGREPDRNRTQNGLKKTRRISGECDHE